MATTAELDARERMTHWWRLRTRAEHLTLIAGATLAVAAFAWLVVWLPLQGDIARLARDLAVQRAALAQAGRAALVPMLDGEIGEGHVRVVGLEPGPMRTPLRAKAYLNDRDPNARPAADHADACVDALAGGPRGVTRNLAA